MFLSEVADKAGLMYMPRNGGMNGNGSLGGTHSGGDIVEGSLYNLQQPYLRSLVPLNSFLNVNRVKRDSAAANKNDTRRCRFCFVGGTASTE